ncbi:MAG: class I SAM-dependent methyltransferase [Pseudomonadota bacterium]
MSNSDQHAFWNGDAGQTWARGDARMAALLAPISEALLDHANVGAARSVLDVGCGGGSGTFLLAQRLAPDARVLAVDISTLLLDVAKESLQRQEASGPSIRFVEADAAVHDFDGERFDLLFSRFGVMFFSDPTGAFAHMRSAMRSGARLAFCCWQALPQNPWTALPLQAALRVLPPPPKPGPREPGPFAYAEAAYVRAILEDSGWVDVDITPRELELFWPGDHLEDATRQLLNMGPVGRLLIPASDEERDAVYAEAVSILGEHYRDGGLRLSGATWLVTARND